MLILNIIIFLLLIGGSIGCFLFRKDWLKNADQKEHKLSFLYPFCDFFLTKTPLEKLLQRKSNITDAMKAIYVTNKPELLQKLYWCRRISIILIILSIFNLFSIFGQLQTESSSILKDGKYLERPVLGEGSREVELTVTMEDKSNSPAATGKSDTLMQDLTIQVKEREYSSDEIKLLFEEALRYLEVDILGDNETADKIYHNLHFSSSVPGTSISVEWKPKDLKLIQSDGTIQNETIDKKGKYTTVTAILTYLDYQTECVMSFNIMPKQYSKEEMMQKKLEDEIINAANETAEKKYLKLPDALENYLLYWKEEKSNGGVFLLFLGLIATILAWELGDKELEKKLKFRKVQMLMDYPEIINKFTLLVNAGMTVKQAWFKIADDYNSNLLKNKAKKRYAYEEMLATVHELKLGVTENIAYEQYGRRTGLMPYIKFSSLIAQNLKKGNKGFTDLLRKEAKDAFVERKEAARRLGEEAGTKLLLPMMVMLLIVFMIILIPAFRSF